MEKIIKLLKTRDFQVLLIIFFLACFMRLFKLGILPHGFYVEEMTNTYIGRFILTHGKDVYGNFFPLLYFNKFGDYPPVIPFYVSGLSTFVFGINEFAGRFPIALAGALTIFPLFAFVHAVMGSKRAGLVSAFLLAVTPWSVVLSRTTSEGILGLFIYVWAAYYLVVGYERKDIKTIWFAGFLLFVTYFLYPSYRIIAPLTLVPFVFDAIRKNNNMRRHLLTLTVVLFAVTLAIASTVWGQARLRQTGLFTSPDVAAGVAARGRMLSDQLGQGHILQARVFHNKIVLYTREFFTQYLSYFSPSYLFLLSGGQYRYFNVPEQGLIYLSLIPLFLGVCFWRPPAKSRFPLVFILYLLLIAPIAAALTVDFSPHAHRSLTMVFPLLVLAGIGFEGLVGLIKHPKFLSGILISCVALESIYFWNQYYAHSDKTDSVFRNDGDREAVTLMKQKVGQYTRIVAPVYDRFPLYYAFYTKNFSANIIGKFRDDMRLDQLGTISFVESECPTKTDGAVYSGHVLFVDYGKCPVLPGFHTVAEIHRSDDSLAYRFLEASK
ncbi:MAG TPA: glycosyltransferase family 39 protein [Patescibacteria group bacterium]|nr:glycosyltransferase family 39 protein [Patescibacteria group bacterium]